MTRRHFFSSVTRITDLRERPFQTVPLPRAEWRAADYVVGEVINNSPVPLELATGRSVEVVPGDLVVGALGRRKATLEVVGSWESVGSDLELQLLTGAGLLGRATSLSAMLPELVRLGYRGHVHVEGRTARMPDFVPSVPDREFAHPVVLVVGSSMSAGKTTTAKLIIRELVESGHRVIGAKLTGAGRYRDILGMRDAGAVSVFDFIDFGLPSTLCPAGEYRPALRGLLSRIAAIEADVVVAEAGASPLEPYNATPAIEELGSNVRCVVLCAFDPYSVVGVVQAFGTRPDLVAGVATSTLAGIDLVEALTGLRALDLLDPASRPELKRILLECLQRGGSPT